MTAEIVERSSPRAANASAMRFREWLRTQDARAGKSSMWLSLVSDFDSRVGVATEGESVFRPTGFRGYNFWYARHDTAELRLKRFLLSVTHWCARAANKLRNTFWQVNVRGAGVEHLAFHPAGLSTLGNLGLDHGYREFCTHFKFSPHSANGIKSYYVASKILPYLKRSPSPRMLEIGGGVGTLATIVHFAEPVHQYVIIDLPEMLVHSSSALRTCFPEMPSFFLFPGSPDRYDATVRGFYFCVPDVATSLPSDTFDVACNVDSFQEMTEQQVTSYLALLQNLTRDGGYLLNLNRRKFLEVERFDNNPLRYPYDPRNEVVTWEIDQFMDRVFNLNHIRRDSWVLRVEGVRKDGLARS